MHYSKFRRSFGLKLKISGRKDAHDICKICDDEYHLRHMTVDHIIPKEKGGTNDISNLQLLCHFCNSKKHGFTMDVAIKRFDDYLNIERKAIEDFKKYGYVLPKRKRVLQYSIDNKLIAEYKNCGDAEKSTGVSRANISMCCRGVTKTSGGFVWKYKTMVS